MEHIASKHSLPLAKLSKIYDNTIVQDISPFNLESLFMIVYKIVMGFFDTVFSIQFIDTLNFIAAVIFVVLVASIMSLLLRIYEMQQEDEQKKNSADQAAITASEEKKQTADQKKQQTANPWPSIRERLLLDNKDDWRLAIIEADIFMERTLDGLGYRGETVSDKLKQITPVQLPSIQDAWTAHKVRNRIAHDGADFVITTPEARAVLRQYEAVLQDLGVI